MFRFEDRGLEFNLGCGNFMNFGVQKSWSLDFRALEVV